MIDLASDGAPGAAGEQPLLDLVLPNGDVRQVPTGTLPRDVVGGIGQRLAHCRGCGA